jgi:metal-responsive CopG/Arc/MetJ family transcriptional regulator
MPTKTYPLSEKLAISLPSSLLAQVEKFRKTSGESRSSFIQRAIRLLLASHARKTKIDQYVAGYSKSPETADEVKAAEAAATYLLAQEPWE